MKQYPPYNKWRFRNESLLSHGQGPYRAVSFRRGAWGGGIRFSHGGYGFRRRRFEPHYVRYRLTATHFGVGAWCVSIIHGRVFWEASKFIPGTPGWRYARLKSSLQP